VCLCSWQTPSQYYDPGWGCCCSSAGRPAAVGVTWQQHALAKQFRSEHTRYQQIANLATSTQNPQHCVRSAALKGPAPAKTATHWSGQSCCTPWRPSQPTVPRLRPLWPPASRLSSSLHGPSAALCGVTPACLFPWIHASSIRRSTVAFASAGDCRAATVPRDCLVANPQPAAIRHGHLQNSRKSLPWFEQQHNSRHIRVPHGLLHLRSLLLLLTRQLAVQHATERWDDCQLL
jgi:hypothetical protein